MTANSKGTTNLTITQRKDKCNIVECTGSPLIVFWLLKKTTALSPCKEHNYIIMITQVDTHLKYNIMQSTHTNYYPVDTHLKNNIMQSTHTNYCPVDTHLKYNII